MQATAIPKAQQQRTNDSKCDHMNTAANNFGLSGQLTAGYDHFLCFSRKCKRRKAEKHKVRLAKRRAKIDDQKASTERTRAETLLMQNTLDNKQAVQTQPITRQPIVNPQVMGQQFQPNQAPPAQRAGMGGPIAIVVGLLLVGGFIMSKKNKNTPAGAATSTQP